VIRWLAVVAALGVAGCGETPAALGITGPGAPPPSPAAAPVGDDSLINAPGMPDGSGSYGPSNGPIQTGGRYFNYN